MDFYVNYTLLCQLHLSVIHQFTYMMGVFFTVQDRLIFDSFKSCRYKVSIIAANQENIKSNKVDWSFTYVAYEANEESISGLLDYIIRCQIIPTVVRIVSMNWFISIILLWTKLTLQTCKFIQKLVILKEVLKPWWEVALWYHR